MSQCSGKLIDRFAVQTVVNIDHVFATTRLKVTTAGTPAEGIPSSPETAQLPSIHNQRPRGDSSILAAAFRDALREHRAAARPSVYTARLLVAGAWAGAQPE